MSMVDIDWRPDARALRKFGLTTVAGFALIGASFQIFAGSTAVALGCYAAAAAIGLPALTGWSVGLPGYWLWMGVAFVLGNIVSRLLLTAIYYLLFTPIAVSRRLLGNDKLALRKRDQESYWVAVEPEGDSPRYERQF